MFMSYVFINAYVEENTITSFCIHSGTQRNCYFSMLCNKWFCVHHHILWKALSFQSFWYWNLKLFLPFSVHIVRSAFFFFASCSPRFKVFWYNERKTEFTTTLSYMYAKIFYRYHSTDFNENLHKWQWQWQIFQFYWK